MFPPGTLVYDELNISPEELIEDGNETLTEEPQFARVIGKELNKLYNAELKNILIWL